MELPKITGYAIYNPTTGLFSGGGHFWNKSPYLWSKLGYLKQHLCMFVRVNYTEKTIRPDLRYKDCVIIDMSTGGVFEGMTIKDYFLERANRLVGYRFKGYNIIG